MLLKGEGAADDGGGEKLCGCAARRTCMELGARRSESDSNTESRQITAAEKGLCRREKGMIVCAAPCTS